ncbi:DUF1304 family protein [Streptomyces pristinaespiralis]|uniref:DUF1304 family protein n=1 Tax=Streptomyces pristinaespiralis TaxID=38300 RepID=UPI00340F54C5
MRGAAYRQHGGRPGVQLWRFNVGFYNLFLALGLIAGFVALHLGQETVGRTLIAYLSSM